MKAMIKVRMNRTAMGAPDSVTEKEYKAGEEYLVPESLAKSFFSDGAADPAEAHEAPPVENEPAPSPGHRPDGQTEGGEGEGSHDGAADPAEAPKPKRKRKAAP